MPNQRANVSRVRRPVARRGSGGRPRASPRRGPTGSHGPSHWSGRANRTLRPSLGAKQRSPRKAAGLSRSPKPPRSLSSRPLIAGEPGHLRRQLLARELPAVERDRDRGEHRVGLLAREPVVRAATTARGGAASARSARRPTAPSSSAGRRCSVPRMAHVLTSRRSSHSARSTSSRSSPSTRAHRVSSADDINWACRPQMRRTTSSASSRLRARRAAGAPCARRARLRMRVQACRQKVRLPDLCFTG